jgi:hypothetical protein
MAFFHQLKLKKQNACDESFEVLAEKFMKIQVFWDTLHAILVKKITIYLLFPAN